jgi:hypothetical protein
MSARRQGKASISKPADSKRKRLAACLVRYVAASRIYSETFEAGGVSDSIADAMQGKLDSARHLLVLAVRTIHGGQQPSRLGSHVECFTPQAVTVGDTLVVVGESSRDAGAIIYLLGPSDII